MTEEFFNSVGKLLYKIAYKQAKKNIKWFDSYSFVSVDDLVQVSICGVLSMRDGLNISTYANRIRCRVIDYYRYLDSYKRDDKRFRAIVDIDILEDILNNMKEYRIADRKEIDVYSDEYMESIMHWKNGNI